MQSMREILRLTASDGCKSEQEEVMPDDKDGGAAQRLAALAADIQKQLRHHLIREGKGVEESRREAQRLVDAMLYGTVRPESQQISAGTLAADDARLFGEKPVSTSDLEFWKNEAGRLEESNRQAQEAIADLRQQLAEAVSTSGALDNIQIWQSRLVGPPAITLSIPGEGFWSYYPDKDDPDGGGFMLRFKEHFGIKGVDGGTSLSARQERSK